MSTSKTTIQNKLEALGYFRYVAPENMASVIEYTFRTFDEDGSLDFPDDTLNRTFGLDFEFIFEGDGIKNQIEGMLPMFRAMGIDLNIGQYVEDFDNDSESYTTRTIELNGKTYDVSGADGWESAFNSCVELLDEILRDYGKDERVYGLLMDETSLMILLTEEQYAYLCEIQPEDSMYYPVPVSR